MVPSFSEKGNTERVRNKEIWLAKAHNVINYPCLATALCNAVNPIHLVLLYLAEKGWLNVCFWEICWSLRMFCQWNCTIGYSAFILWEREDKKSALEAKE